MVNRPPLIIAQPVGGLITGMQRRDSITAVVHGLNQSQFRRQNLPGGKTAFGFNQFTGILHRRFQIAQIHFTRTMRQRHIQQFMLRHDRLALKDMGNRVVHSLSFQPGNPWLLGRMNRGAKFLKHLPLVCGQLGQLLLAHFCRVDALDLF